MASSSVSQEDFDPEYELSTSRRSRVRVARGTRGTMTASNRQQQGPSVPMIDTETVATTSITTVATLEGGSSSGLTVTTGGQHHHHHHHHGDSHDTSPKPTGRVKEKRSGGGGGGGGGGCGDRGDRNPGGGGVDRSAGGGRLSNVHTNKGKQQRDRRKLREKRRSTGVVHLASTESTGGSTGEDDDGLLGLSLETKKNTILNESSVDKNSNHATDDKMPRVFRRRNKSPSDLDADDEDNQDYDSTVNQSDSTMSLKLETLAATTTAIANATTPTIGLGRCRITSNGRPDTPDTESLEDLLERAKEENRSLLELLAEKDHKIGSLQEEICRLQRVLQTSESEIDKLREENKTLLRTVAQIRAS